MCKRILAQQTTPEGDVPFYKIGTIGGCPDAYISQELFDTYQAKYNYPRKGEILISCAGTVGRCVVFDGNPAYFQDSNIVWARNKEDEYTNDFLYYILTKQDWRHLNTTTIVRIYNDDLRVLGFSCPSIIEQNKIATLLKQIDKRISTQNKIIDKLQSLIKGLNDHIQNSVDGECVRFSDLGEAYSGLSGKAGDDFGTGKPFVTYMNVYQNTYISDKEIGFVKISANEKQSRVRYGDALFTLSSETPEEVGMGAIYQGNEEELYLNSFCFGVHLNDFHHIHPQYLAHLISSTNFRKSVYPLAQGSTRFNLQKNDFMRMRFKIPELRRQKEIADTLDNISKRLSIEQQLQYLYIQQKKYLLCQMFI